MSEGAPWWWDVPNSVTLLYLQSARSPSCSSARPTVNGILSPPPHSHADPYGTVRGTVRGPSGTVHGHGAPEGVIKVSDVTGGRGLKPRGQVSSWEKRHQKSILSLSFTRARAHTHTHTHTLTHCVCWGRERGEHYNLHYICKKSPG